MEDFRESPEHVINCLGLAFHTFIHEYLAQLNDSQQKTQQKDEKRDKQASKRLFLINSLLNASRMPKIQVRLAGYQNDTKLKDLRHNVYGRLITIKGTP